jgi:hypothetical protein
MDLFNQGSSKKKTSNQKYKNFIEAFKDDSQSAGDKKPAASFDFESYLKQQEQSVRYQERTRLEAIHREERIVFSRQQHEVKAQIKALQVEIKSIAVESVGLMEQADITAFQAVVNPGVYHKNFFERLISLIKLAKKNIAKSRTWMQMQNHRGKKRQGYWQGVKKSGTSFMLSGERTVSTQSG